MTDPVNDEYVRIGARIKAAREDAHLSQRQLGEQIGVTDSAITQWELGGRRVGVAELRRIARVLRRPLEWFTGDQTSEMSIYQLRAAMREELEVVGRDRHLPPPVVDWIGDIVDEVLDEVSAKEEKKETP